MRPCQTGNSMTHRSGVLLVKKYKKASTACAKWTETKKAFYGSSHWEPATVLAGVAASASEAAGGEFEGGLEHWSGGGKLRHSVRGRFAQRSAFRCSPGTPPGPLREAPGVLPGARSSALSALFLGARMERGACFSSGARGPLPSLQLSLALSLSPCKVSLRSLLFVCGARCCASTSIKARGALRGH